MKRTFGMLALLAVVLPAVQASGEKPVTEPFSYHEDFESGELQSWAGYPPAQDVAWDPSLVPSANPAQGRFALRRTHEPTRPGPASFGVIKKISFLVSSASRLKFSYFFHSYFPADSFQVVVCGGDGKRYSHTISSPTRDRWEQVDVPLASFLASGQRLQPSVEVQAVYWQLNLPNAAPGDRSFLSLDDLEISGERPTRLEITVPRVLVTAERDTPLALTHYGPGDTLSLAVRPPETVAKLEKAWCTLIDPAGKSVGTLELVEDREPREPSDAVGRWRNQSLLRIDATTPRGIWRAEIKASTIDDESLSSTFEFLVSDAWPTEIHPRLYFLQDDREKLLAQTKLPTTKPLWDAIQAEARRSRARVRPEAGRDIPKMASNPSFETFRPYLLILREVGTLVQTNAFVFWLSGDPDAKEAAKRGLLEACRWQTWTLPWFTLHGRHTYYPVGFFAQALAFGYDVLYQELTPEERELVRRAMMDKAVIPSFREYYLNHQIPFHTSNWIGHTAGGPLISLLAISESPEEAEPYFSGLLKELREHWEATYLADGSYGEGIDYQRFDLETSARLLAALQNALGLDLSRSYNIAGSYLYSLYAFLPPNRYLDFGDTSDRMGFATPWAWLASRSRDPYLTWYYEQYFKQRGEVADSRRAWSDLFDFIWYDPQLTSRSPSNLPTSRYFPYKGGVVFRSGWSEDAVVLNFTAGPFFNHNHLDQGSFWLAAFGEVLLTEAGNTEFYTDESYQSYFIQSVGHNVVSVDGDPASQQIADHRSRVVALDRYPHITSALTSPIHDQVRAELAAIYEPGLRRYSRSIMFVKPDYFVLFDRLDSDTEHVFSELFHPEFAEDLELDGNQAWIRKKNAKLWLRFLTPDVQLSNKPAPIPVRDIAKLDSAPIKERAYLEAATTAPTKRAAFLVLLYPQRASDTELPAVERIEGDNLLGLRLKSGDSIDRVGFAEQDGLAMRYGDIATDGSSFRISQIRGRIHTLSFEAATYLEAAGNTWLRSEKAIFGVCAVGGDRTTWHIASPDSTGVDLYSKSRPAEIVVDGRRLDSREYSFHQQEHRVHLAITEGTHTISLRP